MGSGLPSWGAQWALGGPGARTMLPGVAALRINLGTVLLEGRGWWAWQEAEAAPRPMRLAHGTSSGRTDYGLFCSPMGRKPRAPEGHLPSGHDFSRGAKTLALLHELLRRIPPCVPTLSISSQKELALSRLLARLGGFSPFCTFHNPSAHCMWRLDRDWVQFTGGQLLGSRLLAMHGCPLPDGTSLAEGPLLPETPGRCCILFCPPEVAGS